MKHLVVLLAACICLVVGSAFGAVTARVKDYTPRLFETQKQGTVTITVENTGLQTDFWFEVKEAPAGWTLGAPTPGTANIANGRSTKFELPVNPRSTVGVAEATLTLRARNEFGDTVTVLDTVLFLESLPPPGDFFVGTPFPDQDVSIPFEVTWTEALNRNTYAVLIYEPDDAGQPKGDPVFAITGLIGNSYTYNGTALQKGKQYLLYVWATNRVANKPNTDGRRRFRITPPPVLGSFDITSPTPGQQLTSRPVFFWSVCANATSYRLNVLPEVDGVPVSNPVRTVTGLTTTSYSWADPPLEGGKNFYVTVIAEGEAGERFNTQGPVKFFASGLGPFDLLTPTAGQQNVPRLTSLRWERAEGATHYTLRIERDLGNSERLLTLEARVNQPPGDTSVEYFQPSGTQLVWDRTYHWSVTAHTATESRPASGGQRTFRTTAIRPVDLVAPASNATGVSRTPTFRWRAAAPGASCFVQLVAAGPDGRPVSAPIQVGDVVATTEWVSTFPALEPGRKYFWRVAAFNSQVIEFSYGDWQPFTVSPMTASSFSLLSPAADASAVSVQPILSWSPVPGAEGYVVEIGIPDVLDLSPIVVREVAAVDFVDLDLHLNGETTYEWTVTAFAGGAVVPAGQARRFTTARREQVTSCDLQDAMVALQALSPVERAAAGLAGTVENPAVLDAAAYVRYVLLPESSPCVR